MTRLADIHWPGSHDGPPPDVPECGFLGNDPQCQGNGIEVELMHKPLDGEVRYFLLLSLFLIVTFGSFIFIFYYIYCK